MFISDSWSWFLPIPDPGSKNSCKWEGWKNFFFIPFFVTTNLTKLEIIFFLNAEENTKLNTKFHKTYFYCFFNILGIRQRVQEGICACLCKLTLQGRTPGGRGRGTTESEYPLNTSHIEAESEEKHGVQYKTVLRIRIRIQTTKLILLDSLLQEAEHVARL